MFGLSYLDASEEAEEEFTDKDVDTEVQEEEAVQDEDVAPVGSCLVENLMHLLLVNLGLHAVSSEFIFLNTY